MINPGRVFRRLVGRYADSPPLELVELETHELPGYVRRKVEYTGARGDRIRAYLLVPKKLRRRRPAVLALHQHAGEYFRGKSEVVGESGNPEQAYAAELAERGFVVLAPDSVCFQERQDPDLKDGDFERFVFTEEILAGSSMVRRMMADIGRAVDVLAGLQEVSSRRIGCIGHSMGAMQTWLAMAYDRRIKAGVSSCGVSTYEAFLAHKINHCFVLYVPGATAVMDVGDIVGAIAPRAYLALAGAEDSIFPVQGARRAVDVAHRYYQAKDRPERLDLGIYPLGHRFTEEMRRRAYDWLERHL